MNKKYTYKKLVEALNKAYYLKGNADSICIDGIDSIGIAGNTQMTFIDKNRKDKAELLSNSSAGLIVGDEELLKYRKKEQNILVVQNPKVCFSLISNQFFVTKTVPSISDKANIHETAKIGKGVYIGPNSIIGKVVVGANTRIMGNVWIGDGVEIGSNVIIQAGCVIGADGYGYNRDNDKKAIQFPHIGGVIIEDNVELGANTCIDNGTLGPTIISKGAKIDNLVHIGHNVIVGESVYIAAQTSIAGSTTIGDYTEIWTGVNIADGLTIGENCFVGMGSVVIKNIESNKKCFGNPAKIFGNN
ncbi:MAG: UDP-3-O-[3-hydroxymyristoyl] glucosamine N-acyltransferase [Planctomycetota bacterium]|jgi:UDP-3-O-[3-hydroxymyristoyl] glucosamine N-acyltransferase